MKRICFYIAAVLLTVACASCNNTQNQTAEVKKHTEYKAFNADSCFSFLTAQTDMGARVMNSSAHDQCREYICKKLLDYKMLFFVQEKDFRAYDGSTLHGANIIASANPENENRIIVAAHYDSRPWCDEELLKEDSKYPVLGANDGASGVAVMLELIRSTKWDSVKVGVDFLFLDAEDYGVSDVADSYCLGSQHWAKEPHVSGYKARFGILLDMVGAKDAVFYREQVSDYYAKDIVDLVWKEAEKLGYGSLFVNAPGGAITDDHYYINKIAGTPCIDIIHFVPGVGFPSNWHTRQDTPEHISKETLEAVGRVVGSVIYNQ